MPTHQIITTQTEILSEATINTEPNSMIAITEVLTVGGNQAHNNMQPYIVLNVCQLVNDTSSENIEALHASLNSQ